MRLVTRRNGEREDLKGESPEKMMQRDRREGLERLKERESIREGRGAEKGTEK